MVLCVRERESVVAGQTGKKDKKKIADTINCKVVSHFVSECMLCACMLYVYVNAHNSDSREENGCAMYAGI